MESLADYVQRSGAALDPIQVALLIAAEDRPFFDRDWCDGQLAELAAAATRRVDSRQDVERCAQALCALIADAGFRGSADDYYNADNSYIDFVLRARTGIPISLALIYLAAGAKLDLRVEGVSFPRHFLVAVHHRGERAIIDPFANHVLSLADCAAKLAPATPALAQLEQLLQPCTAADICVRMVSNLLQIYLSQEQFDLALGCHARVALFAPQSPAQHLELARIYRKMGRNEAAIKALTPLLDSSDSNFRRFIEGVIKSLHSEDSPKVH